MSNIVEVLVADRNLSTISKSIKASGMETALNKPGPYTFFAPTEIAFSKLHEGEFAAWLKPQNKVNLTEIMSYHVVKGKTNFKDFKDSQKLKTLNGQELSVNVNSNRVTINGVRVQSRDHEASNGVVHFLDAVLMPLD